jgi:AraC-like DNA-binding protein
VLPDGCTELIVHRGRPFWQASRLFVGQMLAPVVIAPGGAADIVAIRFEPFGAFALLGIHQSEPADQIIDAEALGAPWLSRAMRSAASAVTAEAALAILERALTARLERRGAPTVDPRVLAATRSLTRAKGSISVEAAAASVAEAPAPAFADIAATTGYFDQAHMIREFVTLAGTTPGQFRRSMGALTRMMLA